MVTLFFGLFVAKGEDCCVLCILFKIVCVPGLCNSGMSHPASFIIILCEYIRYTS